LTYAAINSLLFFFLFPTSFPLFLISMIGFNHVCYSFSIKFNNLNKKFDHFLASINDSAHRKYINYKLIQLLREHNHVCVHLYQFNHFWTIYLAIKYLLFPAGIQLCLYNSFFAETNIISRSPFFICAIFEIICLSSDSISASMVRKKAHSCYLTLNRICMSTRLSPRVKIKLNNYIQRFNAKSLSFTCFNLFSVTYATYFIVS
jgi:hypothetical protein